MQFLTYQNGKSRLRKNILLCRTFKFWFLSEKSRFHFLCCFCFKSENSSLRNSGQTIVRNFKLKVFDVSFYCRKRPFKSHLRAISGPLLLSYFGLLGNFWKNFERPIDAGSIETFNTRSDPWSERVFNVSMDPASTTRSEKFQKLQCRCFFWHFFLTHFG